MRELRTKGRRGSLRLLVVALLGCLAMGALAAAPSFAGTTNAGLPGATSNPLTGVIFPPYFVPDRADPSFDPPSYAFMHSSGADRVAVGRLIAQPRFRWFGAWYPTFDQGSVWGARTAVRQYIQQVTGGNPDLGVQLGVFRLQPFENCGLAPSAQQQASYRQWIDEFAAGIGTTRTVLELQPDNIFTLCATKAGQAAFFSELNYAVQRFNALPFTTVYIDAGAADWLGQKDHSEVRPRDVARMLAASGVRSARGFTLNVTHYEATNTEILFGHSLLWLLHKDYGIDGKHFIVNTAQNGHPFTTQGHPKAFRTGAVCAKPGRKFCAALGQPPTTATGDSAIDGFLWVGRPWVNNADRRGSGEIVRLVTTSPFVAQLPPLNLQSPAGLAPLP